MHWWLKSFVLVSFIAWVVYYRFLASQLIRTRTKGFSHISTSLKNNTETYHFLQQSESSYFEFENTLYAHGLCGDLEVAPLSRPCTPPLHIHLRQIEYFTLLQGQLGYQLGDEIISCDVHTCPKPLIIQPGVPHTFWMNDNKEDLTVLIRVEPANRYNGLRRAFFENFGGVIRDESVSIWQIFVLFDNAETYLTTLPLSIMKIITRIGALIGQLLGFKHEYEEYTTD
ncbi:unnamed protein product [Adineta ricciae]|uniref:Cupin 2 conserved barrel domain-containing protein n=1 Tax=Adineta ricciae TaxID=249248 RepID=A0A815NNK9_ADIRI|nr:unnamed protein product [Adineta ricciae]CAF1435749.1 unnamed protein product [Adineta ricciae]